VTPDASTDDEAPKVAAGTVGGGPPERRGGRHRRLFAEVRSLVEAIDKGDDDMVQDAVLALSRSRRIFAPLGMVVGAFVMLFQGVKLLVFNWRLTLVEILPAMWIWLAMFDIKVHVVHGKHFHDLRGPKGIPIILAIAVITAGSYFLNAVFAFAIAGPRPPKVRPAFAMAWRNAGVISAWGLSTGLLLGVSAIIVPRWGLWWFALSMSIVVGIMMLTYVAVPSRVVGIKSDASRRDKLTATAVGGTIGAIVCSPPYALARLGVLMLGVHYLFIPGLFVLTLGVALQCGATGAVKAIKMSAKLVAAPKVKRVLIPAAAADGNRPLEVGGVAAVPAAERALGPTSPP
jgi:hypothetical protein